jgi:hypothetical protein
MRLSFFRSIPNPLGEKILAGMISVMEPETARQITSTQAQFLPALFHANPSLASSPQLWVAGGDRKRELFEAVAVHENLDPKLVGTIVSALLESGSDLFISRALDRWGKDAVFQTLDWTDKHHGAMSETCREALKLHLSSVMDWVESKPISSTDSLSAIVRVVAPFASQLAQRDSTVWLNTFRHLQQTGRVSEGTYIRTFLLALALNNAPPSPLELVSEAFERVHDAARKNELSDSAWVIVEPSVPELSWLSNWDKCERLRRGLISAFLRYRWPASELMFRIKNDESLEQLLKSARRVNGGEEYFRLLPLFR